MKRKEKAMSTEKVTNEMVEEKLDEKNTVEEAVTENAKEVLEEAETETETEKKTLVETVDSITTNVILDKGDRCIRSIIERNGATGKINDIKFVLSENGKTYLGLEKLISIPIEASMDSAAKFDCLMELKRYDYSLTDNDLKVAFENLQQLVRNRKFIVETDELAVMDVLDMVIEYVEFMVAEKKYMSSEEQIEFDDKYRVDEESIMISTKIMDEVLQEVGAEGYTKTIMCKRIALLEKFLGVKILHSNRSGNRGYDYNTTGNKAFYKIVRNWRSGNGKK